MASMLIGEYRHTLDPKKRLSLPAKFRKELGRSVVITRGLDHCLFLLSESSWKKLVQKFSELSIGSPDTRGFNRFMLSGAVEAEVDSAGRILVPDFLKDFANLKTDVVLAGVGERVEVWDAKRWSTYKNDIESRGDAMAGKLAEAGVL